MWKSCRFPGQAEWTQNFTLSSPLQGSGPFLQALSRVRQCLEEQLLLLLLPIKLPRLVSVTLWDMSQDPLASMGSPLCKEPFLGGRWVGSSSPMYVGTEVTICAQVYK